MWSFLVNSSVCVMSSLQWLLCVCFYSARGTTFHAWWTDHKLFWTQTVGIVAAWLNLLPPPQPQSLRKEVPLAQQSSQQKALWWRGRRMRAWWQRSWWWGLIVTRWWGLWEPASTTRTELWSIALGSVWIEWRLHLFNNTTNKSV